MHLGPAVCALTLVADGNVDCWVIMIVMNAPTRDHG